jgi:aspartate dehydrogenase
VAELRVGLIGLGAIATRTAELIKADPASGIRLIGALVRDTRSQRAVDVPVVDSLAALLDLRPDVVAEAAGHEALRQYGPACLRAGVPLVFLSVGALSDPAFERDLGDAARAGGVQAIVASGGVGGLDIIASLAEDRVETVVHTIVKPPHALGIETEIYCELYRGPARGAALKFPQNANVAAAIAMAGIGLDRTTVVIAADPAATTNRHEIEARGVCGRVAISIDNQPTPANPRTGAVVGASLKHALERFARPIAIG